MGKTAVIRLIKTDPVLSIAAALAAVSCFFVRPDSAYLTYIDLRTLALLFCLMAVMKGFQETGFFSAGARALLKRTKTLRQSGAVLILLCFFSSMLITNDVALITFVPFAMEVLEKAKATKSLPLLIVMQTVAANLGSMLTPVGNPQNLYLFSASGMSGTQMLALTLPYWLFSLGLLLLSVLLFRKSPVTPDGDETVCLNKRAGAVYSVLLMLCLLCVAGLVHFGIIFAAIFIFLLFYDRHLLLKVDYTLLLTFAAFFIFIGNIGRIPAVNSLLQSLMDGREILTAVLSSQIISNVPAALLLSGFTSRFDLLIIGTNLGGLGTLIASMASLISYKYVASRFPETRGKYFRLFTAVNLFFLFLLYMLHIFIH